jgi:origin recognition complex subunit 2
MTPREKDSLLAKSTPPAARVRLPEPSEEKEEEEESSEEDQDPDDAELDKDGMQLDDEGGEEEENENEDQPPSSKKHSKGKRKMKEIAEILSALPLEDSSVHRTAFDAYFELASRPARTSSNVFSAILEPLTQDEYTSLLSKSTSSKNLEVEVKSLCQRNEKTFPRRFMELIQGFNLIFYGYGSKHSLLTTFAKNFCSKRGHVIVINGFFPNLSIKDVLSSIEKVPELTSLPLSSTSLESQAKRIYEFFLPPSVRPTQITSPVPLFLIIHNLDSPQLRTSKIKSCLSLLALNPRIHIVASVDHINSPLMFTTSECSARKHTYDGSADSNQEIPSSRGFAWLWHDMTTFEHYDLELSFRDVSSLGSNVLVGGGVGGTSAGAGMTETGAKHVLASVTEKAKRLFVLLSKNQLASASSSDSTSTDSMQQFSISYDALFSRAREEFIATSDVALRALLGEFRDHGLVLSATSAADSGVGKAASEVLWIPLGKEALVRVLKG